MSSDPVSMMNSPTNVAAMEMIVRRFTPLAEEDSGCEHPEQRCGRARGTRRLKLTWP